MSALLIVIRSGGTYDSTSTSATGRSRHVSARFESSQRPAADARSATNPLLAPEARLVWIWRLRPAFTRTPALPAAVGVPKPSDRHLDQPSCGITGSRVWGGRRETCIPAATRRDAGGRQPEL